jgi:hypothetical protein
MAQDSNVRVTWSNSWGFGETLSISQTEEGATILREFVRPAPAIQGVEAPSVLSRQGDMTISQEQFTTFIGRLMELGIADLGNYVQPNIDDAPTYHFEGTLEGTEFNFTVYGILSDFEDAGYAPVLRTLYEVAQDIEMEEVPR